VNEQHQSANPGEEGPHPRKDARDYICSSLKRTILRSQRCSEERNSENGNDDLYHMLPALREMKPEDLTRYFRYPPNDQ